MKPRIRSVKPELLQDENLWDLGVETGWPVLQVFVGLWCYADREGRFEWRPRALRPLLLPYWDGGDTAFAALLDALARARFIVRYEVDGKSYGYVRTFLEHQVINAREAQSTIPPPPHVRDTHVRAHAEPSRELDPAHGEGNGTGRELEGRGRGASADTPALAELAPGEPSLPQHPGPLQPSKRERAREQQAASLGAIPPLRHQFRKDWDPSPAHRVRGHELGLSDEEILAEAEDCRRKTYAQPFANEDDQFFRELQWLARDRKTQRFKDNHERERFENPGRERVA